MAMISQSIIDMENAMKQGESLIQADAAWDATSKSYNRSSNNITEEEEARAIRKGIDLRKGYKKPTKLGTTIKHQCLQIREIIDCFRNGMSLITEEIRFKAEVFQGPEICREMVKIVLAETNLPNGLIPLENIEECGHVKESGFVWFK
ncbi:hypothetical protein GIB67_019026 [Kingdonia uniflora]|uniref:Uncharacterized protein n=1 Tax=Kingdonia uniflora TaxID=39325 RepID=A0A7J7MZI9_9MAGN|nr:hypothetical protein GIB67_019026 [Kingdonia uniflora]